MSFVNKFSSYILVFLLFLLQLVYFPIGVSHFEAPKVYTAEIAIFVLLLVCIFKSSKFFLKDYNKSFIISLGLLLLLSLIHILFFNTETTLFGNPFRLQGVFLLWMLILFAVISAKAQLPKLHSVFFLGIIAVQFICALFIEGTNGRAVGTLGEPNALAAAVIAVWPFLLPPVIASDHKGSRQSRGAYHPWRRLLYHFIPRNDGVINTIALIMVFIIIIMSGSRSGMIAFVLQLIFFLVVTRLHLSLKKAVVISLVLLMVSYVLPFYEQKGIYEKRSEVWQTAVAAGANHAILGHGFGNTEFALRDSSKVLKNNLASSYVDSSHNLFLDWWVQGGVVGLVILFVLLVQTMRSFIRNKQVMHIVLFLGLLTSLSFNPASIVSLIAFWWIIGKGVYNNKKEVINR